MLTLVRPCGTGLAATRSLSSTGSCNSWKCSPITLWPLPPAGPATSQHWLRCLWQISNAGFAWQICMWMGWASSCDLQLSRNCHAVCGVPASQRLMGVRCLLARFAIVDATRGSTASVSGVLSCSDDPAQSTLRSSGVACVHVISAFGRLRATRAPDQQT